MASEKNNSSKNFLITGVIVVIVAAGAFFGGMKYQQSKSPSLSNGQFASSNGGFRGAGGGMRTGGNRGGTVVGKILSMDQNSITVQLQDGSSKIVNVSATTTYSKSATGSKSDLTSGINVAVFGTSNSDGSVTAQSVQINPIFRMGGAGPRTGEPNPTQGK